MSHLTEETLAEIEKRYQYEYPRRSGEYITYDDFGMIPPKHQNKYDLIMAHAREDIPALLADLRARTAEVEELKAKAEAVLNETTCGKVKCLLENDALDAAIDALRALIGGKE